MKELVHILFRGSWERAYAECDFFPGVLIYIDK